MNIKRIWLMVPAILLPYISIGMVLTIFFSAKNSVCRFIMEQVFGGNAWYLIGTVVAFALLAFLLTVTCFVLGVLKKWDDLSLARSAMIIKLVQIPAYIVSFILSVFCAFTILLIAFTIAMILLNSLSIMCTGLLTTSSVINARRKQSVSVGTAVCTIILQCVPVADVILSVILFCKLSKRYLNQVA